MNFAVVTLLSMLLSAPALLGLAERSLDPDEAGLRVLLAVGVAVLVEAMVRRFVVAVRPADMTAAPTAPVAPVAPEPVARPTGRRVQD